MANGADLQILEFGNYFKQVWDNIGLPGFHGLASIMAYSLDLGPI